MDNLEKIEDCINISFNEGYYSREETQDMLRFIKSLKEINSISKEIKDE